LTKIPTELGNLTRITILSLHDNKLTKVPTELGRLVNCGKLYLDINELVCLPEEFCNLRSLTNLDVDPSICQKYGHRWSTSLKSSSIQIMKFEDWYIKAYFFRSGLQQIGLLLDIGHHIMSIGISYWRRNVENAIGNIHAEAVQDDSFAWF